MKLVQVNREGIRTVVATDLDVNGIAKRLKLFTNLWKNYIIIDDDNNILYRVRIKD